MSSGGGESDGAVEVVGGLLKEMDELFVRKHHVEVIGASERVVRLFGDRHDAGLRERVAYALLLKGLSLDNVGRSEEAIQVYERLIARHGDSADPQTGRHVAWAFNNRAYMLKELGRREESLAAYDELMTRFCDAREPEIRVRVSWALWNKAALLKQLSRVDEARAVYDELIGRRDEGLDAELDRNIAWSMEERAWTFWQAGRIEHQVQLSGELIERFGDASDVWLQRSVLRALRLKASGLVRLGQRLEAAHVYETIVARFREASDVELRHGVAETLVNLAVLLVGLDRPAEATAAYDEALALLAQATEPQLRDQVVMVLLSKGDALWRLRRLEEAIVVYDGAAAAIDRARLADGGSAVLWAAVLALFHKVDLLCTLDRPEEVCRVRVQFISLLGDVAQPGSVGVRRDVSEQELAAAFSDVFHGGECWRWFEGAGQEPPTKLMVERAIELYRVTEPWALADAEDAGSGAQAAAASMLREIADGYAMLARPSTAEQTEALPLPKQDESQLTRLIRTFGVDEWTEELGYPLVLPEALEEVEATDPVNQLPGGSSSIEDESPKAFLRFFLKSAYEYDLLAVACESSAGREALRQDDFKHYSTHRLAQARRWVHWIMPRLPDTTYAALAARFIAEGFFLASYGAVSSGATLFPTVHLLRDLLSQGDAYDWLIHQDVALPEWLADIQ